MHQCKYCPYQSSRKYNLNVHERNKHGIGQAPTPNPIVVPEIRAPTTISVGRAEGQGTNHNHMVVPDIKALTSNQVHHLGQDQHQQDNVKNLKRSKGATDKFDRLYQAVHGKTTNVNQSQGGNCDNSQCTRELSDDIDKVSKEFNKIGVECFTKCSDKEVKSVCFIANTMMMSIAVERLKDYRPHQYECACRLLNPSEQLVEQLACPRTSVQEKRKILQQTNLGAMLLLIAVKLVIPTLFSGDIEQDILNRFFR